MTEQALQITRTEGRRATEELVRSIPEPKFTKTWHPHSHAKVIDATEMALKKFDLKISDRHYSLSANGQQMFGLWDVGKTDGKTNCIGFRNSIDMTMSIGYISVLTVVVCTNQITNGNYFVLRRHTSGLAIAELADLASGAIERVIQDFKVTDQWHEDLKGVKLDKRRAEQLIVHAMRAGVVAPSKFKEFDELYFGSEDKKPAYDHTLYGFHGVMTQLIRDLNFGTNIWMNQQITTFVDKVQGKA